MVATVGIGDRAMFIIDGYNLLYAVGLARSQMTEAALTRARQKMLLWLSDSHRRDPEQVRVIFDAQNSTRPIPATQTRTGIQVEYSFRELADDRIEFLIQQSTQPQQLTVISNDNRVAQAARRKGCRHWSTTQYLDWLLEDHPTVANERQIEQPEKPIPASSEEIDELLRAFSEPKVRKP